MNDLMIRLEQWNEEDKYQEIIDAIEALPKGKLNFTLISALARAYNNIADPDQEGCQSQLKKAEELGILIKAVAAAGVGDQCKKILTPQVIDPRQRRPGGGDDVLPVGVVEVTKFHRSILLLNDVLCVPDSTEFS